MTLLSVGDRDMEFGGGRGRVVEPSRGDSPFRAPKITEVHRRISPLGVKKILIIECKLKIALLMRCFIAKDKF